MAEKAAVFIDGGYLNKIKDSSLRIDFKELINSLASPCTLWRSYYYDCLPYQSTPPTQAEQSYTKKVRSFYSILQSFPRLTLRLGKLKFRGMDQSGKPIYIQKQVDLMLGLDIASVCTTRVVDMIVLVTGDGDLLPAVKAAKDAGVIVKLVHGCDVQDPQHGLIHRYDRSLWQEADERQAVGDSFFQQFLRP